MHTKMQVKDIEIQDRKFTLLLKDNKPLIECNQEEFTQLGMLTKKFPLLSNPTYIKPLVEIANFLWKGLEFECIFCPECYQKFYVERVEMERKHPIDVFPFRLTDYKIFDVSVMHHPLIEKDQLLFFTYNTANGLPYRVVCPFPYPAETTLVHYQILPLLSE